MSYRFEEREPPGLWGSRQPKFERLVMRDPNRFYLEGKLASGEEVTVQLGGQSDSRSGRFWFGDVDGR